MEPLLTKLQPQLLWKHFDEIRKIPRESKNETAIAQYIVSVAQKNNYEHAQDAVGNIVIRKPATTGHENADTLILQSHMDMVCEKNSDIQFDFKKDAIQLKMDGDWLMARGTTLGADNGIGVAAMLAVLEDHSLIHGPLELLFTVDEETGLTGAFSIQADFLTGRKFLNLDSEEEGVFTIGCSGGGDTEITIPVKRQKVNSGVLLKVHISGLKGGHSGLDINTGRGNAIKMLTRILWKADRALSLSLVSFTGGNKRNAIAREAAAEIIVSPENKEKINTLIQKSFADLKFEFRAIEKDMLCTIDTLNDELPAALTPESQKNILNLLFGLPHGVLRMSLDIPDLVETSTNLAIVKTDENEIQIGQSSRSSIGSALAAARNKLKALAELAGGTVNQPEAYPGWTPNLDSEMLNIAKQAYKNCFGKEPEVAAIHAGLECGLIGEKFPGMDMVSFGPDLRNPHSPDEKVHVGTVEKFWQHLIKIMEMTA